MGGHFWEASLFKGPKGGYPPKKIHFFLEKSLVNGQGAIRSDQYRTPKTGDILKYHLYDDLK